MMGDLALSEDVQAAASCSANSICLPVNVCPPYMALLAFAVIWLTKDASWVESWIKQDEIVKECCHADPW